MSTAVLLPAKQLRASLNATKATLSKADFDRQVSTIALKIHENRTNGQVTVLTLSDEVVNYLRSMDYIVRFDKACGMGDIDSHTILW